MIIDFQYDKAPANYPYTPTEEQLKKIAAKAIEDDKNGLFIDGEEFFAKLRARREARIKQEEETSKL